MIDKLLLMLACAIKHDTRMAIGLKYKTCVRCKAVWKKDFKGEWVKIKK